MPHLLKRLELNGFKSFAQKTTFDFSDGITAIVGPNGSGKSNIIDAIRWLLGEREAKNLRGGKSEDLIFSGTAKRPRVSQAQASLYFDNAKKFFPVEFSEVAVARRVSRDGTNQYFLNKAEVRLKDVIDFFAQARLGSRGFVVVTQGNSDVFIRVTPKERREMIEEILGLREYQLKKAEAERRLRTTQANLDKAKALIEEILPHLRSLKRQTGRWEKRETLAEELRALENRFFGSEWKEIAHALLEAERALKEHEKDGAGFEKERHIAEQELKKLESAQPQELQELQGLKKESQEFLEKKSALQKELGRLEAQIEMAGKTAPEEAPPVQPLVDLIERLRGKLEQAFHKEGEELMALIEEALTDIDDALAAIRRHEKKSGHTSASSHVEKELKGVRNELAEIEKSLTDRARRAAALEKRQEDFYDAFKKAVARFESAKDALEGWHGAQREELFKKERLAIREAEWEKNVRQAGRAPGDFRGAAPGKWEVEHGAAGGSDVEHKMFRLRGELAAIGEIDEALVREAKDTEARYEFLVRESEDLKKAQSDLKKLISGLTEKIQREFAQALTRINEEFSKFFDLMFGGGQAKLKISNLKSQILKEKEKKSHESSANDAKASDAIVVEAEQEKEEEEGIEVEVKLPRKRRTSLAMLSGGERSLVGIAALFALISVSPPPFLVLDEVDAPLDERNARRFSEMLKEFSKKTQFVIVTHNRVTMEVADILYGITTADDDTSKVVSLKLESSQESK